MQLCRIVYCSLTALHVSSDIFAHHQQHLNCMYSFWYYSHTLLPADVMGELELTYQSIPTHPWHQPATTYMNNTRSCTYSLDVMKQSPSWEANWFSASQEIPPEFYGTRRFITAFTSEIKHYLAFSIIYSIVRYRTTATRGTVEHAGYNGPSVLSGKLCHSDVPVDHKDPTPHTMKHTINTHTVISSVSWMSMYKPKELISSPWQPNIPSNISLQTPTVYFELIHFINLALCTCICNRPSCYMCYDGVIANYGYSQFMFFLQGDRPNFTHTKQKVK